MSAQLTRNEGACDRAIRVLLGLAILSLYFAGPETPWALFGSIPLVTGLLGRCPVYALFGINTCPLGRSERAQLVR